MRIGILIKKFENLSNWELRIVQEVINNPELELSLLIKDDRIKNKSSKTFSGIFFTRLFSKFRVDKYMLRLQQLIEIKIFFKEILTVDKTSLIRDLNSITTLKVKPFKKDLLDIFSLEDSKKIQKYELDLILKLGFNTLKGEILNSSKYGVWCFSHVDYTSNHQGPIGFWEVLLKEPVIGFALLKLTSEVNQGLILDNAFFNRHWSFIKTNNIVVEGAVSVLFKNIRKFMSGNPHISNLPLYTLPLLKSPSLWNVTKYVFGFYYHLSQKIIGKLLNTFLGIRYECWTFFLGTGNFLDSLPLSAESVELPKNEFWADPFLFKYNETDYVFFENYSYITKKGKISCGIVKGPKVVDVVDVLDLNYHLSFPFIFEENGSIYLMPETCENKRLEIYKSIDFPTKWELYTTAFEGESVADAVFFNDEQNQKWLFINKQAASTSPMNSELFIYKTDSLKLNNLQPHTQNPVIIDARVARNGGAIFKHNNHLYRPSQSNVDGLYGRALNINRIEKLNIDEYIEKNVKVIEPNFNKNLMAMHHLHQVNGLFVFDAAYKRK